MNLSLEELKEQKKYDEIFEIYGAEEYRKAIPKSYSRKELKRLIKAKDYKQILEKFGEAYYIKCAPMKFIKKETYSLVKKKKKYIQKDVLSNIAAATVGVMVIAGGIPAVADYKISQSEEEYSDMLSAYNEKKRDYAEKINKLGLNQMELFMKVMYDQRTTMEGYGTPKTDIVGLERLDFLEDNQPGVCRNMADDYAATLNSIDSNFNAVPIFINFDEQKIVKGGVIGLNNVIDYANKIEETESNQNQDNTSQEASNEVKSNITPNHAVVLADSIEGDGINFIIDPTNPCIGFMYDGKMYMPWCENGEGLDENFLGSIMRGSKVLGKYMSAKFESYFCDINLEELKDKLSIINQNKALVSALQKSEKIETKIVPDSKQILEQLKQELLNAKKDENSSIRTR